MLKCILNKKSQLPQLVTDLKILTDINKQSKKWNMFNKGNY
jgi:hypothetical protein